MSVFFCLTFLMKRINTIILPLMRTFLVFFWIWLRCTLPRYRYDILISLAWFSILPASLYLLFYLNWVYIF
jgi:NADH-ubiquinone oxidoreductase chain 1